MSNIKFYEVPDKGIFIRTWNKPILMEVFRVDPKGNYYTIFDRNFRERELVEEDFYVNILNSIISFLRPNSYYSLYGLEDGKVIPLENKALLSLTEVDTSYIRVAYYSPNKEGYKLVDLNKMLDSKSIIETIKTSFDL